MLTNIDDVAAGLELMGDWTPDIQETLVQAFTVAEIRSLLDHHPEDVAAKFEGVGGWHRYYIKFNGSVCFSEFHALPENTQKARDVGFEIFE